MKIAIIHPWFPQYRQVFFSNLINEAQRHNISIELFFGETPPEWGDRGDSVSTEYAQKLPTKFINFFGKTLTYKNTEILRRNGPYDLLIVEQAVRNIETYRLLLRKVSPRLAFWGHGRTYTKSVSGLQEWLKIRLTLRADWFFAYTNGGVKHMREVGFDPDSITLVQNSIDSTHLSTSIESITEHVLSDFRIKWNLSENTAVFIGGLDASKRLDFIISACDLVVTLVPDFCLLVIGDGNLKATILEAEKRFSWLKYLGPLFGEEKVLALKASKIMVMPGRVGLVAVDSFASITPIVTTDWEYHAPEFEYLVHDVNSVISKNNSKDYAAAIVHALSNDEALISLQEGCSQSAAIYTSHVMVDNFLNGIKLSLGIK